MLLFRPYYVLYVYLCIICSNISRSKQNAAVIWFFCEGEDKRKMTALGERGNLENVVYIFLGIAKTLYFYYFEC